MNQKIILPAPAMKFLPHRPPMSLINRLLARDRAVGSARAEVISPKAGIFVQGQALAPEYFIELIAQTAAAATGHDAVEDSASGSQGYLVGVDEFSWPGQVMAGEQLEVAIQKTFAFGQVSIMEGWVRNSRGEEVARGKVRVWEEVK